MSRPPHLIQIQATVRLSPDVERRIHRVLTRAARSALEHAGAPAGSMAIRVVGDAAIRKLNRDFLGHDYATDVLSFPADPLPDGGRYFGDLALSLPRARAQAQAGGHALEDELRLLTVHGVLHLLGHDHDTPAHQRRMWRAQATILVALGSAVTAPKAVHAEPLAPR